MNKQCGNCKWWDIGNKLVWSPYDDESSCIAPLPVAVVNVESIRMKIDQGQDCKVFEERKE